MTGTLDISIEDDITSARRLELMRRRNGWNWTGVFKLSNGKYGTFSADSANDMSDLIQGKSTSSSSIKLSRPYYCGNSMVYLSGKVERVEVLYSDDNAYPVGIYSKRNIANRVVKEEKSDLDSRWKALLKEYKEDKVKS